MNSPARLRIAAGVTAATAFLVLSIAMRAPGATNVAGSQGVNPQLAATASQVTVSGQGPYAGMKVTVNQTQSLTNQAVSVSWTGATPTSSANVSYFNGTVYQHFVAIFECWGDPTDQPSSPDPGPPPSQCEAGASALNNKAYPIASSASTPFDSASRILDEDPSDPTRAQDIAAGGVVDPVSGAVFEPFKSVDGTVVQVSESIAARNNHTTNGIPFWNENMPYSYLNTNEIDYAHTYSDGTGSELFQVDTGLEASGLGCGQHVEPQPDGTTVIPQCWLVVVPQPALGASPLKPTVWQNRIAIPLQFNTVDSSCPIGADARRIVGGEMASLAVSSWQPTLCGISGNPPYNYTVVGDDSARQDLLTGTSGTMSVASSAADNATDPATWAPITLSGVVIGFNINRVPGLTTSGQPFPDEVPVTGSRIGTLYLTPRLVAKLLTQSYLGDFDGFNVSSPPTGYSWLADPSTHHQNPVSLVDDPDFLQFNPEFAELQTYYGVTASQLAVELGSSDAASLVWNWVLSDPEAASWLAGTPDPWGMEVNPLYSTSATTNPSGTGFGSPVPDQYPKNDPYCAPLSGNVQPVNGQMPAPPCVLNWSPYALNMKAAAQEARSANDGSKTTPPDQNTLDVTASDYWQSDGPEVTGEQFMLTVTDSASAQRYGLQVASLSADGDDSAQRTFVAPSDSTILQAVSTMPQNASAPGTLSSVPAKAVGGAYPLALLSYAGVQADQLDAGSRHDYAAFLNYAAGAGQDPGAGFGQLPPGYVPLPANLRQQATQAAAAIANRPAPPASPSSANSSQPASPPPSAQGTSSPSSASSTPTVSVSIAPGTSVTSTEPPQTLLPPSVRGRTARASVGLDRFGLPIAAVLGLLAAAAVPLADQRRWRRTKDVQGTFTGQYDNVHD